MTDMTPVEPAMRAAESDLSSGRDLTFVKNGVLRNVHPSTACRGRSCWVHNPSDHALSHAPVIWDEENGRAHRVCEHDQVHVDPDDGLYWVVKMGWTHEAAYAHECDGCCGAAGGTTSGSDGALARRIDPADVETTVSIRRPIDGGVDLLRQLDVSIQLHGEDETRSIGEAQCWVGWDVHDEDVYDAADAISSDAEVLGAAAQNIISTRTDLFIESVLLINRILLQPQFRGQRLTGRVIEDLMGLLRLPAEATLVLLYPEPQSPAGGPMADGPDREVAMRKLCDACRVSGLEPWRGTGVWWKPILKSV